MRHRPVERRRPRGARLAVGAGGGSAYEVDGLEDLDEVLVYLNESAAAAVVDPRKRLPVPGGVCMCSASRQGEKGNECILYYDMLLKRTKMCAWMAKNGGDGGGGWC